VNGAIAGAGSTTPAGTWDAATANWNALSDGTGSTGAWVGGNTAVFAAGTDAKGAYTVTVDGTPDISGLTFEEGTVTLSGGMALRMTANTTADVAPGLTATIATPISDVATGRQLTKAGTGTLVLAGANTYTGPTTVIAGKLQLTNTDAIAGSSGVTLGNGTTLELLSDSTATFNTPTIVPQQVSSNTAMTIVVNNNGSGTGNTLTLSGGLVAAITTGNLRTINVTGDNGYTLNIPTVSMTTSVTTGTLTFNPTTANVSLGAVTIKCAGGDLNFVLGGTSTGNSAASIIESGTPSNLSLVTKQGAGTWTVGDITCRNGLIITAGKLIVNGTLWQNKNDRTITLSGATTELHYNNPAAVKNQPGATVPALTISGGKLDNSSGAAITTSTYNPTMAWNGDWTFIGSNGAASDLNLGTGAVTINATRQVTVENAATTLSVGGVISGATFGLTKAGPGTLVLAGANTYTGTTTVSGGTLEIGGAGQLGGGTYPGSINITAGTFKYNSLAVQTLTGAISGPGGVTKAGTGTLVLAGMNAYTGGTTVIGGTLSVAPLADSALGTGPVTVLPGATLLLGRNNLSNPMTLTDATLSELNAFGTTLSGPLTLGGMVTLNFGLTGFITFNGNIAGAGGLIQNGTRHDMVTTTLNGTNTYTGPTVINGALEFGKRVSLYNAGLASWTADKIVVNSGGTAYFGVGGTGQFTAADIKILAALGSATGGFTNGACIGLDTSNANFFYTSVIADTNSGANKIGLQKFGNNALTLGDDNTYTGPTSIRGGTLMVTSINRVVGGTGSSSLGAPKTVADGTIMIGYYTKSGTLVYTGPGEKTDRVLYTPDIGGDVILDQSGAGLLKFTSDHSTTASGRIIYLQGSTAGEGEFAGSLGGTTNFRLIKKGTGTWTLSGTNLYTGTTTVSGGALKVTGSINGSDVTVNNSGTLGGGGSVKSLIVQTGGKVAPGDSAGTLRVVAGNVSLGPDAVYEWEFNGTSGDLVSITGDLTLDNDWTLRLVDAGGTPKAGKQYDLFTYTANYSGMSSFGLSNIDAAGVSWNIANASIVAGGGRVYITGIPEPATLSLLALAAMALIRRRRK
jgi:autotransporter-associated beta strand protein